MASSAMEYTKKVIVIGDSAVGKTSFIARVTEGRFISDHKATIGGKVNDLHCYCISYIVSC